MHIITCLFCNCCVVFLDVGVDRFVFVFLICSFILVFYHMPFVSCEFKQGHCTHQHPLYAYNSLFTYMKAQKRVPLGVSYRQHPNKSS